MTEKFPKKYDLNIEEEINKVWLDKELFKPETVEKLKNKKNTEKFVISLPPPNVTWVLHLGHACMLAIEDAMARYARMKWKTTLWVPWTDHAWIATQVVVEKKIAKEDKLDRHTLWRERFLDKVWEWVRFSRSTIVSQVKRMWASCDWSREQFTMSEKLSRAVRKSFSNLYSKGKIYQSTYIINWCCRCQTVLSDLESIYKEQKSKLYYIRYFIEGKWDYITVATVRPETIFADVAIAVNPKDKRFKKFVWKNVLIPIINKSIPVIGDDSIDITFWTWALKVTPAHDEVDFKLWQKHNLPLDQFAIDKNWNLTQLAWEFAKRNVDDVFDNIIQYLKDIWNLEKIEDYINNVPHCERCWTRIQPQVSKQWFVDVKDAAEKSVSSVKSGETKIYPERFNKIFFNWLDDIRPWCISRQLWWGHRIPVWHCAKWHINVFDEDLVLAKNWKSKSESSKNTILSLIIFNLIADSRLENPFNIEQLISILISPSLTPQEWNIYEVYLNTYKLKFANDSKLLEEISELEKVLNSMKENSNTIIKIWGQIIDILENCENISNKWDLYKFDFVCQECWDNHMHQDEDVLDTWFSSALWPFSILGWPEQTPDFQNFYPNTVLETWYDILFFWVARMMFMWFENLWKSPFEHIYLHGIVRDENGEKMSKSKGNVIDPLEIIEKYWADALRLSLVVWSTPGNDIKFSTTKVDYNWRFLNKLWNASRFIYMKVLDWQEIQLDYELLKKDISENLSKLNDFDKWILHKINDLVVDSQKSMDKFMIWEFAQNIIKTTWHEFCDWYIEISKLEKSVYTDKVLLYSIWTLLKLLHPYVPFITEKLWKSLNFDGYLVVSDYPELLSMEWKDSKLMLFIDLIGEFRNLRQNSWLKPHEKCEVYIQSNNRFLDFAKWYETLLKTLVNTHWVSYVNDDKEFWSDFVSSVIIDVKIWIRWEKTINWEDKIKQLQNQLESEKQFLQNIRNLLASPWFMDKAPENVVEEKTKKMEEVKLKILKIETEINKIKMERK